VISSKSRKRSKSFSIFFIFLIMTLFVPEIMAAPVFVSTGIPSTVQSGEPIHIIIEINSTTPIRDGLEGVVLYFKIADTGQEDWVTMNLTSGNLTNGIWTYDIPSQSWEGSLECRITAKDNSGFSTQYPASSNAIIEIIGDEPPEPFPWNWVIIIAFLGIAFVVTELVFKPGFYRATGREKAKALEEEDRRREEEEAKNQK
jgi:hypothetical protein